MGRVLTNNTAIQYSIEDTENNAANIGQLQPSPVWFEVEPNTYNNIGATITTVARNPISRNRQNRKGTITDLDSAFSFEADTTLSHLSDFLEGFVFSRFVGASVFSPSSADADSYTVTALSPTVTLAEGTLIYARGFGIAANNGLKNVDTGATTTDIPVDETLVVEASPPAQATVEVAGFRTAAGDLDITDVTGTRVTITSTANVFNNPGLDIVAGSAIYFGGEDAINKFSGATNVGYARIVSVATDGSNIVIDKTMQTWVTEVNTTQEVDFYVGRFLRNVPVGHTDFLERSFQFEISYPGLGPANETEYEYSRGNYCNTLAFNLPLTDKSTITPEFVGLDTDPPTQTRATNAASPRLPTRTEAISTTADIARLRVQQADETGLTTDFKSVTVNLSNNVSPEKVLGVLGARFMNYGNFEVSIETQLLFTSGNVVDAIRNNSTVTMDFVLRNADGALYTDIPSLTLGGGNRDFPANETVLINLTQNAFADDVLNTSVGFTLFPFIPAT